MQNIFKSRATLSDAEISKKRNTIFKSSFFDLDEDIRYWDPMGWRGEPVNGKNDMHEAAKEALDEFHKYHVDKNWPLGESIKQVAKNYDTGDFTLPSYFVPEVQVVNPEQTPAADMIARQTVNQQSIKVEQETDQPRQDIFGLQQTDDTEGSYIYSDGTYNTLSYDVTGYGFASRLEDKLRLAQDSLRNTQSLAEQLQLTTIRQVVERQILTGQYSNGWSGMTDLGSEYGSGLDLSSDVDWQVQIRDLINEVEYKGGNRGNIAVFTDFETFVDLQNDLQDYVRYQDVGDELGFGFQALEFDGVPIMKTHGIPKQSNATSDGDPVAIAADMGKHYMAMLQDISVKPLAKVGPAEQFATDAYGVFVSEATSQIQYLASDGTLS